MYKCRGEEASSQFDAGWMFLDRYMIYDHRLKTTQLVCIASTESEAQQWFERMKTQINIVEECLFAEDIGSSEGYHRAARDSRHLMNLTESALHIHTNVREQFWFT